MVPQSCPSIWIWTTPAKNNPYLFKSRPLRHPKGNPNNWITQFIRLTMSPPRGEGGKYSKNIGSLQKRYHTSSIRVSPKTKTSCALLTKSLISAVLRTKPQPNNSSGRKSSRKNSLLQSYPLPINSVPIAIAFLNKNLLKK